ncbi:hypothetical protein [Paractinoplanes hotanensis]|uniref:Uncharacterized protein n=1 Tax=Paractinoplanes hotanensis TaxID=2906497 RepID=A0ABT0YDY5_9ACTN|nr:hypothetical protein [Actinoplanes hotanensis]MCM4083464.1 hypothetical protein [Actinoplanes hotanensis]
MTQAVTASSDRLGAFHRLLLRLAGRTPDELITTCRRWLAEGEDLEIAQAVVFAALVSRVEMTDDDVALLTATLVEAGEDTAGLDDIERTDTDPPPPYGLAPVSPADLAEHGDAVPYCIDLTAPYDGPGAADEFDRAAIAVMAAQHDNGVAVAALWRAWRFPSAAASWPPPRRMYLVQGAEEAQLAARTQAALEAVGETDPQVEAFLDPEELPAFQRTALGFSTLLWTAAPPAPLTVARVYDTVYPESGPLFAPDHPLLEGAERDRVLSYLSGSTPLLITAARSPDVVNPAAGDVVPAGFFTDGRWIWTEAVGYYLDVHGLAPDPGLLAAIRAADHQPPQVDAVVLHRALSILYAPVTAG